MKQEILDIIRPQIQAKAQELYYHFEEAELDNRRYESNDYPINSHIEESVYETEFVNEKYIKFGDEIDELIEDDEDTKYEIDELISEEICKYIDWSNNFDDVDDHGQWEFETRMGIL